jgi:hypothetical protein
LGASLIETDEWGFKKTDFVLEKGAPVVLFVGDSFTEGLDVASPDTFVSRFGTARSKSAGPSSTTRAPWAAAS